MKISKNRTELYNYFLDSQLLSSEGKTKAYNNGLNFHGLKLMTFENYPIAYKVDFNQTDRIAINIFSANQYVKQYRNELAIIAENRDVEVIEVYSLIESDNLKMMESLIQKEMYFKTKYADMKTFIDNMNVLRNRLQSWRTNFQYSFTRSEYPNCYELLGGLGYFIELPF